MSRIKVIIVDDSALVRQSLTEIFAETNDIDVVAVASDPYVAVEKLRQFEPDVIILDVEMPRMDGITFLKKIMSQHPMPVVICSTLVGDHSESQIKALEYGAVDIILKPTLGLREFVREGKTRICDAVRGAALAKVKKLAGKERVKQKLTADAVMRSGPSRAMSETTEKIIVIGASTGGTEAVRSVLESMPLNCPAIAVVQHMPEGFTRSFAERLNRECQIRVKEAENNDTLIRGHALIAAGNRHMLIKRSGARYYVEVKDGPLVSRHKPSVDVLFRSTASYAGQNAVGAILTGMGDDGASGLLEMREAGAMTFGQDEASSVVYGMPRVAYERGGVKQQLPLDQMTAALLKAAR